MLDIAKEQAELAKADECIQVGERRIASQTALIAELRRDGHDTYDAEKLLWTMQQVIEAWKTHRDIIRAIIEKGRRQSRRDGS